MAGRTAADLVPKAVASLVQFWQHAEKRAGAGPLLAEIGGWLTEGGDTKDGQEAKALCAA